MTDWPPRSAANVLITVRHQAQQKARAEVGMWLLNYADEHGLSDLDMLTILNEAGPPEPSCATRTVTTRSAAPGSGTGWQASRTPRLRGAR